jgi:hypothetical protein
MQEEHTQDQKARLAVVIARGNSISAWARKNDVPVRTALKWASELEVRKTVELWRRRALSRAIDILAAAAPAARAALARHADSRSIQPRAKRAKRVDRKSDADLSNLEKRLAAVEKRLRGRDSGGDHTARPADAPKF